MPSKTRKQARMMAAVAHGWRPKGSHLPPLSVAREFNQADKGTGILRKAGGGVVEKRGMRLEEDILKNAIHNNFVIAKAQDPSLSDEEAMKIAINRARLSSAIRSQWMTLDDETGKAKWGLRPGIVDEFLSLGTLPKELGITDSAPDVSTRAAERTARLGRALNEEMGVPPAQGFGEHLTEAVGTMGAQLPVPSGALRSAGRYLRPMAEALEAAPAVVRAPVRGFAKTVAPAAEWFLPTVDPSAKNYLSGALFGAGLNTLGDYEGEETVAENKPKFGIGGMLKRLMQQQGERSPDMNFRPYTGMAEGGRVGALSQALKKLAAMMQGEIPTHEDTSELVKGLKGMDNVGMPARESINNKRMMMDIAREDADLGAASRHQDDLLNQLAEVYFSPRVRPLEITADDVASASGVVAPGIKRDDISGLTSLTTKYQKAAEEAAAQARAAEAARAAESAKVVRGIREAEMAKRGGYADGGRANRTASAVAAIKQAIAHLKNGDHSSAAATLRTSRDAMADPSVAELVGRLRTTPGAKSASDRMRAMVEDDINAQLENAPL